jgi:hypothetical protein
MSAGNPRSSLRLERPFAIRKANAPSPPLFLMMNESIAFGVGTERTDASILN